MTPSSAACSRTESVASSPRRRSPAPPAAPRRPAPLIFPADSTTAAALDAAGQHSDVWFERNVGVAMPTTSVVAGAPRVAILVNSVPTSGADTDGCLARIFGAANVKYVATTAVTGSLQTSSTNPLNGYNVIYNAGGAWPSSSATIASNLPAAIRSTGATESGNIVTITMASGTTLPGTLKVGSSVTITGVTVTGYNGTFTVVSVPSATTFTYTNATSGLANSGNGTVTGTDIVAGASESGDTVTITLGSAYIGSITTGSSVTIAGVGVAGYNGTYTVTGTPSATQFTYTNPTLGLADSGGGTVTSADVNARAKSRLNAFFAHGGGYIATSASTSGFSFLSSAVPALVSGSLTQGSQSAYGGIAQWVNVAGTDSPISGAFPSTDNMFLPSNVTYFSAVPSSNVTVDGQYPSAIATVGPANGFDSGMWLNRDVAANNAPVLVHGTTTANSRYVAYATNPFSRYDAERVWPLIFQAAIWSDLTDEGQITATVTATAGAHGEVSPTGATLVAIGADETYTITPDTGYHVTDVAGGRRLSRRGHRLHVQERRRGAHDLGELRHRHVRHRGLGRRQRQHHAGRHRDRRLRQGPGIHDRARSRLLRPRRARRRRFGRRSDRLHVQRRLRDPHDLGDLRREPRAVEGHLQPLELLGEGEHHRQVLGRGLQQRHAGDRDRDDPAQEE